MEALDDDKIGAIGVYGMGGVGKTTLLKEVENGAKESKKFDGVFSVFVSQTPNLTSIRAEIDYKLKRLSSSDASRKNVLIIFDDLWKPLDLKYLGVPDSNDKLKVKLVMTSRNKHLLADEMSCQRTFSIGELDVEEAWRFFAVLVSSKVEVLKKNPVAEAFLKKCAGLPVSIEALASLWKKKKMGSSSGDLSEDDLKKAKELPNGFVSLELSYNSLEDGDAENKTKLVFRTIGLLNTPKVPILTLIKYMVGLGLFGSSASYNIVERARMEITRSLRILQESSLLLESEDSEYVKIHDIVRDVAVGIASREDHALIFDPLKGVKEWSEKMKDCKAISLTSSAVKELHKKGWNSPDHLNTFVLEAGDEKGDHHVELPEATMVNLRVIHLKNVQITSLPPSINPGLENLTTLCLENCCLEDIAVIGKLVTLQVLSLTGSDLAKLPEEIGGLTNLRMLDLSKCSKLVFIELGVLGRLTQLEELYLRESFDKWEIDEADNGGKHNASLDELNSMPRLRTLEVRIPDTSKLPQNLPLGDLVQSKVLMGESWDWSGDYSESRTLKLEVKHDSLITEEWFQSALQKTQDLHLEGLDRNMESFHELCRDGFKELKHLHLQNSSSIEHIIWSTEWLECNAFTALESMVLEKMGSLVKICDGRINSSSFSKLKVVRVQGCNKLMSIFNISLLNNLTELEEIEISDCDMVQQIVLAEPVNDDEDEKDAAVEEHQNVGMNGGCSNIFFSRPANRPTKDAEEGDPVVAKYEINKLLGKLRYLTLSNLPEITSFLFFTAQGGPYDESMETTVATPVFFNDDQKVSQKPPKYKEIWSTTHLELNKLQRIELIECKKVVHFTNSQVLLKLVNLESLTISGCESLEDVFDLQGIEPGIEILPKLYELKLTELPTLEHIWKKNSKQQIKGCRKLRTVELYKCTKLLYLSSLFMCEVMENLTEINVGQCYKMESIFLEEEGRESASSVNAQLTSLKILVISNCWKLKTFIFGNCQPVSTSSSLGLNVDSSIDFTWRKRKMAYWCYGSKAVETSNHVDTSNSFFNEKVLLPSLEMLILSRAGKFEKLWCGEIPPDQSYCKLEYLHVEKCEELQTVIPASLIERLHNLKQLWVECCDKLEVVFDLDVIGWNNTKKKSKAALMLPKLQQMKLKWLENLTHLISERGSENDEIVVGFPSLNRIEVSNCKKLINLISTNTATTLLELNSLDISWSSGLLEVIGGSGEEVSESSRYKRNAITFPHLISLSLRYLDSITCFSSESHRFDFTCLKIIKIDECKSLKKLIKPRSDVRLGSKDEDEANIVTTEVLFNEKVQLPNLEELYVSNSGVVEEFWNEAPTTSSFCKLKLLEISKCSSLQNVIPSFMVKRLQNLERLCISRCDSLQDIFNTTSSTKQIQSSDNSEIVERRHIAELESIGESRSQTHETINISFTKLIFLELEGNPELSNMWLGSYTLEIPSLKKLVLNGINGAAVEAIMEKVCLSNLEELEVSSLEITEVWHIEPVHVESFSKLKRLEIKRCGALVKIIPFFMLKRLQNLEELVVKNCNKLETVCEAIKSLIDSESSSKLLASFSPFQKLVSVHVEECECLRSIFSSISAGQHNLDQNGETIDNDSSDKIVQLPQLTHLRLTGLPKFSHLLFQHAGQYVLELSSLKEFFLVGAGDKETVTHKVRFPERLEIQLTYFFGSTTSILTDIVKTLQTSQVSIIGLLGSIGFYMIAKLKQLIVFNKEEGTNLFDQVVNCLKRSAEDIQEELGRELEILYGEADVQGRAERLRKRVLSYIRNKRLLLIVRVFSEDHEGILEAVGIPPLNGGGVDPNHLKIILVSSDNNEEFLQKMGAKLPIIPIGHDVEDRWWIFKRELEQDSQEAYPTFLQQKQEEEELPAAVNTYTDHDICCFVGPNTIVLNNIMAALRTNMQIIGILGSSWDSRYLSSEVGRLLKEENLIDETVDSSFNNRVDAIQEKLKTALGITTTSSSSETTRECIRQTLISTTTSRSSNQLLQKKRLLLVLPGLYKTVDLEAVGIPPLHQVDPKFFKIILTSDRTQELEDMGAQQIFKIQSGYHNFYRTMDGYVDESDLLKLADECGSDDLAKVLAKKLKTQGLRAWANAFQRLKESPFNYEDRKKVIHSL